MTVGSRAVGQDMRSQSKGRAYRAQSPNRCEESQQTGTENDSRFPGETNAPTVGNKGSSQGQVTATLNVYQPEVHVAT